MSDLPAFPPNDIRGFLAFCAGEWLALRSTFLPGDPEPASGEGEGDGDEWHSSERGELTIAYQEPTGTAEPGSLLITPPGGASGRRVTFSADGRFHGGDGDGDGGQWQLWPDGSLELVLEREGVEVRERIWFTKPNLRLRSTIERGSDGRPARASFSSEIRRVSRPAAPVA